jgi:tetratricopeptide (TPR) repeat protein
VRASVQPPLAVAERWARETGAPREHLLLARALVAEERHAEALASYRIALRDPAIARDSVLLEAASAAQAADSLGALEELTRRWLALYPGDEEMVLRLARAYGWRGDYAGALRHYARLGRRDPALRLEIAQILVWSGQERQADTALRSLVAVAPENAEAWKLLGDLASWRGQWSDASSYYLRAQRLDPGMPGLAQALATASTQQEAARLAALPRPAPDAYDVTLTAYGDNQRFQWVTTEGARGFRVGDASLRVRAQHAVYASGPAGLRTTNPGVGARLEAVLDLWRTVRIEGSAGAERYAEVRTFPSWSAGVTARDLFGAEVTVEFRHQLAAARLASLAALQARATTDVLAVTLGARSGRASLWARAEAERIASIVGPARRATGAASLAYALTPRLSAVANLSAVRVDRAAPVLDGFGSIFWAPESYVEPTAGLTYRATLAPGLAANVGVSMGYGFVRERAAATDRRFSSGAVPTGALSADLAWTRGAWDVTAGATYGGALQRGYRAGTVRVGASWKLPR